MNAMGASVEIRMETSPVPPVKGIASELREALINLILNATDAMPAGGVLIFRLYAEDNRRIILDVEDTGTGMDEATIARCREPFFTTKGAHGSGMGLAMVSGIVERYSGNMEIKSKKGAGTTIRLSFPVPDSHPANSDVEHRGKFKPSTPLQVLVVDDELRSRELIVGLLQNMGHNPVAVGDGSSALDAIRRDHYDIVITDHAMPKMDGEEFVRNALSIKADLPIVMLTGFGDMFLEKGIIPAGIKKILSKPVTLDELNRAISEAMLMKSGNNDFATK